MQNLSNKMTIISMGEIVLAIFLVSVDNLIRVEKFTNESLHANPDTKRFSASVFIQSFR